MVGAKLGKYPTMLRLWCSSPPCGYCKRDVLVQHYKVDEHDTMQLVGELKVKSINTAAVLQHV